MKKIHARYVLDSFAILVLLNKESGFQKVSKILNDGHNKRAIIYLTSVNYGEILYVLIRELGSKAAEKIMTHIENLPITITEIDLELAKEAAYIKSSGKLSYADCFAAALAKINHARLVTGDKEFKTIAKQIDILWL